MSLASALESSHELSSAAVKMFLKGDPYCKMASALFALAYAGARAHYFAMEKKCRNVSMKAGNWSNDIDEDQRSCKVYLVSRKMVAGLARHISVEFHFADDYKVTYEAYDDNGTLTPSCIPATVKQEEDVEKIEIADLNISPKTVNLTAKNNKFNWQTYSLIFLNCQTWVFELLIDLKISSFTLAQYNKRNWDKLDALLQSGKFPGLAGCVDIAYCLYVRLRSLSEKCSKKWDELYEHISQPVQKLCKEVADIIHNKMELVLSNIGYLFTDPSRFFILIFK